MQKEVITLRQLARRGLAVIGQEIILTGWVRTVRSSGKLGFIQLSDGTVFSPIQIVFEDSLGNFEAVTKFSVGVAISVLGTVVESPGKGQELEIQASDIKLLADCDEDFPLQKKRHTFEFLREISHLRPRSNTFQAVFRLRSLLGYEVHRFFQEKGFVNVHTPIITGSDCEGAGELFTVTTLDLQKIKQIPVEKELTNAELHQKDFFKKHTGLTVSGQLNAECFAMAFRDVYTFGPTFRAENSNTARHAAEFWMIEPEMAFATLKDDMQLAEEMMKHLIKAALEQLPKEMEFFNQFIDTGLLERLNHVRTSRFEHIPYTKAVEMLEKSGESFEFPVQWGIDLQSEHEQWLCKSLGKPVIVTDYPKDIKAFYMHLNDDGKTVAAMDVLVPGIGEIIGGSQREVRLDVLDARMKAVGIDPQDLWWYRDLRRFGGVDHAGFGMGFERLIQYISGMGNIRDVIPFPRTPRNCEF